jgi:hypothetical protein
MAPASQRSIASMFGGTASAAAPGTPPHQSDDKANTPNTRNRGQNKRNYRQMDSFRLDEPVESPSQRSKKPRSPNASTSQS